MRDNHWLCHATADLASAARQVAEGGAGVVLIGKHSNRAAVAAFMQRLSAEDTGPQFLMVGSEQTENGNADQLIDFIKTRLHGSSAGGA